MVAPVFATVTVRSVPLLVVIAMLRSVRARAPANSMVCFNSTLTAVWETMDTRLMSDSTIVSTARTMRTVMLILIVT